MMYARNLNTSLMLCISAFFNNIIQCMVKDFNLS